MQAVARRNLWPASSPQARNSASTSASRASCGICGTGGVVAGRRVRVRGSRASGAGRHRGVARCGFESAQAESGGRACTAAAAGCRASSRCVDPRHRSAGPRLLWSHLPHPQRAAGKLWRRVGGAALAPRPLPLPLPPAVLAAAPRRRAAAVRAGARRQAGAGAGRGAGRAQDAWPPRADGGHCRLRHSCVPEHQQQAGAPRRHLQAQGYVAQAAGQQPLQHAAHCVLLAHPAHPSSISSISSSSSSNSMRRCAATWQQQHASLPDRQSPRQLARLQQVLGRRDATLLAAAQHLALVGRRAHARHPHVIRRALRQRRTRAAGRGQQG